MYADKDENTGMYGVFGTDSGFCYDTYADRGEATAKAEWRNNQRTKPTVNLEVKGTMRGEINCKRMKLPGIVVMSKCPSCGTSVEKDMATNGKSMCDDEQKYSCAQCGYDLGECACVRAGTFFVTPSGI